LFAVADNYKRKATKDKELWEYQLHLGIGSATISLRESAP